MNVKETVQKLVAMGVDAYIDEDKHVQIRGLVNLTRANLSGADFAFTNLRGAILTRANLSGANLSGADFAFTNLRGAKLSGVNFTRANFTKAILTRAILTRANLSGADFAFTNLRGANFRGANLTKAILTLANVENTNIVCVEAKNGVRGDNIYITTRYDKNGMVIGYGVHLGCYYSESYEEARQAITKRGSDVQNHPELQLYEKSLDKAYQLWL